MIDICFKLRNKREELILLKNSIALKLPYFYS